MKANTQTYLESWAEELNARAARVRQLIGDKHWGTDGRHKEVIVREFLNRYLPKELSVGSGFVKSLSTDQCSPEIDVLVSDNLLHPPFFNEGEIQIVPSSAIVAMIEVKSTYSSSALRSALSAVSRTRLVVNKDNFWSSVCFAMIDVSIESYINTLEHEISKIVSKNQFDDPSNTFPNCISSFDKFISFIRVNSDERIIVVRVFDWGKLCAACFFTDLFEHALAHMGKKVIGELALFIERLSDQECKIVRIQY